MVIKEKDFVEIDFTATTKDGNVFDTTLPEVAKKAGLAGDNYMTLTICVGQKQLLKGLDNALVGKEVGKEYEIDLKPEEGFGKRKTELIQIHSVKKFHEQKINPYPGLPLNIDNRVAKVMAVSGGRVTLDFNHPLAGKDLHYKFNVKRIIESIKEKAEVMAKGFFRTDKVSVNDKEVSLGENFNDFLAKEFEKKAKELIGDFTVSEKKAEKKDQKLEEKKKV